jgi:dihydroflavonol-4-reductase
MKVAVTGASGHIGSCLVRELIKKGARVKVLVHDFENDLAQLDVEMIHGNLLEIESLKNLCEGVEVVFHLAAKIALDNHQTEQVYEVNVTGTNNMIEATKWAVVKKFIHFSSIDAFQFTSSEAVMDEIKPLIESEKSIYAFTKAESERLVLNAVKEGLDAVILSPTAVIGPFDYRGSFLGSALLKIYQNKIPMLISGGYNWVDVRDIAAAAIQSVDSGRKGEKYILSGNFCNLLELSKIIGKISGKRTPKLLAPVSLAKLVFPLIQFYYSLINEKPIYTRQSLELLVNSPKNISFEKAKIELGYEPRSLEQTLRDTFNWYIENKYLNG